MGLRALAYFVMHALFSALLTGLLIGFVVTVSAIRYSVWTEPPLIYLPQQPGTALGLWGVLTSALLVATLWRERRRAREMGYSLCSYAALPPGKRARLDAAREEERMDGEVGRGP